MPPTQEPATPKDFKEFLICQILYTWAEGLQNSRGQEFGT